MPLSSAHHSQNLFRRITLGVLVAILSVPAPAQAGFWQTLESICRGNLFPKRRAPSEKPLVLPPKVRGDVNWAPMNYIQKFRSELYTLPIDQRLQRLIARVRTQAQYEALKRVAGKPLAEKEIELLQKHFESCLFVEQAVLLTGRMGQGWTYPSNFDERSFAAIFGVKTPDQFALYASAEVHVKLDAQNYFRAEVIPRVTTETQRNALELLVFAKKAEDHDLLNLALLIQNPHQVRALEEGVDRGFGFSDLRDLLKIQSEGDFLAFRKKLIALEGDVDEGVANIETISANKKPEFWFQFGGYAVSDDSVRSIMPFTSKVTDKKQVFNSYMPEGGGYMEDLSDDAWVAEAQLRKERLRSKKDTSFVYSIFNRESKRRTKFDAEFISYLKDEDRVLPYERITLVELRNTDNNIIGVFGLFDATPNPLSADNVLPFLRKRPNVSDRFSQQVAQWKKEMGKEPRIFEVRRLALHPNATQVDVNSIRDIIEMRLKSLGIYNESVIMGHTDHSGNAVFQRKWGMHELFNPQDLKNAADTEVPDEHVLFARPAQDWK